MKAVFQKPTMTVSIVSVLGVAIFVLIIRPNGLPKTGYRTFISPDKRFQIEVYRSRQWCGTMPGQSGDAPGTVCLYERATGKLLEKTRVGMVQIVEQVTWSATNVDVKFVADWNLKEVSPQ